MSDKILKKKQNMKGTEIELRGKVQHPEKYVCVFLLIGRKKDSNKVK